MALNSSGPISLAGTTAGQSIELENGGNGTTQISLNDAAVRTLAGVASGAITMPTNFWGKSNNFTTFTAGTLYTVYTGSGGNYSPTVVSCAMSPTRVLYVMRSQGSYKTSHNAWGVVLDISGTAITVNAISNFTAIASQPFYGVTAFDSTYALLSLGTYGYRLIKITGSTPNLVGSAILNSGDSTGSVCGLINSTQMLVSLFAPSGGTTVKAAVVTRSGDTISAGTVASLSTGSAGAITGYGALAACGSSTTGAIGYMNRLYGVTISGTTVTFGGSYVTAATSDSGSSVGLSYISNNLYLVSANRSSPSDNVSVQTMSQSGATLTLNAATNLSYTAGTIPAASWNRMYYGSTTAAIVQANYGAITINISGTTISSTKTNTLTTLGTLPSSSPLTTSTVFIPRMGLTGTTFAGYVATAS